MKDFRRQEVYARKRMRQPMARAVRLTNDLFRLAIRVVQNSEPQPTTAGRVMRFMLTRLFNDVRAAQIAAQTAYPIQAIALTANAFELAYRALYICDDDVEAEKWALHDNLRKSYPDNLMKAVVAVYQNRGLSRQAAEQIYRNRYTPLAAAKHANPKVLTNFGLKQEADTLHIYFGPAVDDGVIKACRVALLECNRVLGLALSTFIWFHMPEQRVALHPAVRSHFRRTQRFGLSLQGLVPALAAVRDDHGDSALLPPQE